MNLSSGRTRPHLAAILATAILAACGGGGDSAPAPGVSLTRITPASDARGAALDASVELVFSEPLTAGAANLGSVTLEALPSHRRIRSTVSTSGATVTLTHAQPLSLLTRYEVSIADTVSGASGLRFAGATSAFTTRDGAWQAASTVSAAAGSNADAPSLSIDPTGNALAVWHQYGSVGGKRSIWASAFAANTGTWGSAQLLEFDDTGDALDPQVSMGIFGDATVVWSQSDGVRRNIWASRYSAGSWGAAQLIEFATGDANSQQVATDYLGNAVAVWLQRDASGVYKVVANRFDATTAAWGGALPVENDGTGDANTPRVVIDQSGNATVVWTKYDGSSYSVWFSRYAPGPGTWSAPALLESDGATAASPALAVDTAGNVIAVWRQSGSSGFTVRANRYSVASGTWSGAVALEADDAGSSSDLQVACAPDGQAIAIWARSVSTVTMMRTARLPAAAGAGWLAPRDMSADGSPRRPQIGMDSAGNALAVWSQQQSGGSDRTVASRYDAGADHWSEPVSIQKGGVGTASDAAAIAVNAQGGQALAIWPEFGGARFDIVGGYYK